MTSDFPCQIDFETTAIEARPAYPPKPIGVSIKEWGLPAEYLAWGHKSGNNTTKAKAKARLATLVTKYCGKSGAPGLCMHHGKFDSEVMEVHLGIPIPAWEFMHDTTFVLFIHDPNLKNIGLKPAAEEILGWPADEKDAVADWAIANQPVPGIRLSRGPKSEFYFMKFLEWVPGDIVGPYANGDTERTEAIFAKLYPLIVQRGMLEAYNRERRLMPVLLAMEKRGVRVDLPKLRADVADYQAVQHKIDQWLCEKLNKSRFFNLDSEEFVDALVGAGFADKEKMGITSTGKTATNKLAIASGVTNKQMAAVLQYRAQLHTAMATFMEPWLKMAEASGGFIYSNWNQVRGEGRGARTGRLSSSPNFQNIPKTFKPLFSHEKKGLPVAPMRSLRALPLCRAYIIPYQDDHVLIDRDYNQNELRIMAHYEDGGLLEKYKADIWLDIHDAIREDLKHSFDMDVHRDGVKTVNFGIIYGMGVGELARRLGTTVEEAKALKKAILSLYPGIDDLYKTMRQLSREEKPLITLGGRENYCEPPTRDKATGKMIEWSYKMINTLVQGSAGDAMKEGMIRYADAAPRGHFMLIQVHDQVLASVPRIELVRGHRVLRETLESVELDVPLLSEGKFSNENWAVLKPYDKRGVIVAQDLPQQKGI